MFIKSISVKGYRGIFNEVTLHPAKLNILVGRNNVGKSSILDAISLAISALNDYKDIMGRSVPKSILFREKKIRPDYLVNKAVGHAEIKINLDEKLKISLIIKSYSNLKELMQDDEPLYAHFTRWFNQKVEKTASTITEILFKEIYREHLIYFYEVEPSGITREERIIEELERLEKEILKGENTERVLAHVEKIKSLMRSKSRLVYKRIISTLKPKLHEIMREDIIKELNRSGFVIFKLMINDEPIRIDWTPLMDIEVSIEGMMDILEKVKPYLPRSYARISDLFIKKVLLEALRIAPLEFTQSSLYTLYNTEIQKYRIPKLGVLYLAHRGIWRFEDLETMFSEIFKKNLKENALKLLSDIPHYDRIKDLSIVKENEEHILTALTEQGYMPITVLGDGYLTLLRLIFTHFQTLLGEAHLSSSF